MKWLAVLLVFSAQSHAEEKPWREKMREVADALSEVIPYLYPTPDKDIKGLNEKVEKLRRASESLDVRKDHIVKTGDFDPGLVYLANSFQGDIDRAYFALQEGFPDYAKYVLKNSTSYCIACHTRMPGGTQFPLLRAFDGPLKSAPWIARLEFLAASRQFDAVIEQVLAELKKPQVLSSFDLDRGVRLALSIAIRVKQDPALALDLAKQARLSKSASDPLKESAKDWERDIRLWQKEKKKTYASSAEMIKAARALVKSAQGSPNRGHDEVGYLRATGLLFEMLKKYPDSTDAAEAFYLIGESYTPLQELALWNLQEVYFRACIFERPHSLIAEKCYKRFEESLLFGFSGSGGTRIPPPLQRQLHELKNKAAQSKEIQ